MKHGDEWGEPSKCDSGDSCQYCHSRTEQQFHPEVSEFSFWENEKMEELLVIMIVYCQIIIIMIHHILF